MVGEAAGGRALVEEDDGVAEEDGDGDGQQEREEPMAGGGVPIAGESPTDGVLRRELGGLCGTGASCQLGRGARGARGRRASLQTRQATARAPEVCPWGLGWW